MDSHSRLGPGQLFNEETAKLQAPSYLFSLDLQASPAACLSCSDSSYAKVQAQTGKEWGEGGRQKARFSRLNPYHQPI